MRKKKTVKTGIPASGAVRVGEIMPQIMARYGFHRRMETEQIAAAWNRAIRDILPENLVPLTLCGALRQGTLNVRVPHAALRQELALRETEILETLRRLLPEKTIRKMKFSLS